MGSDLHQGQRGMASLGGDVGVSNGFYAIPGLPVSALYRRCGFGFWSTSLEKTVK